jgi:hypothetical protein
MNQQIHPHPDLLPSREKELRFVIRIGAFRREDLTNQIRHCEERSDVAISTGSSLLFFSHCKSISGHDKSSPYKNFKNFRHPEASLSEALRISSFTFYSKENNL